MCVGMFEREKESYAVQQPPFRHLRVCVVVGVGVFVGVGVGEKEREAESRCRSSPSATFSSDTQRDTIKDRESVRQ